MDKKVLITGFGPFKKVKSNPSWGGVESMKTDEIEKKHNIKIIKEKIDAEYKSVDASVPNLWQEHQPELAIHVGVGDTRCFLLEEQACKKGYVTADDKDTCPVENKADGLETMVTDLNVEDICKKFNSEAPGGLQADTSKDAGKFLCEYTYYTSLVCRGSSKTIFVHIPIEKYSVEKIALGLERIVDICLMQLKN